MATVLKIPAKFHPITHLPETKVQKRRVAAYARVSTDSEEQQTSYAAQVDRYTKYIQERADWEFVAVYTDEGISALNTKHRDGFNRMVADALDGKDEKTGEDSRTYTFRYVGVPHALYMQEHNLCLEEYIDRVHSYSADNPLEITADGKTYQVFYVGIGGTKDVQVTIPSGTYTASGDNISGYIVTCE